MRRLYNIIICTLTLAAVACTADSGVDGNADNTAGDNKGAMRLNIALTESEAEAPFALRIFSCGADGSRSLVRKYTSIGDIPEYIWLVAGPYCATVEKGEAIAASFEGEYYYGEADFTITPGEEPSVVDIICYAKNIPVEVAYDESITTEGKSGRFENFSTMVVAADSYDFATAAGDAPQLQYDESTTGYFILPEDVSALCWQFVGTYKYADGEVVEVCKEGKIENVAERTHYKLAFRYSPDANGTFSISASVDTSVDHRDDHFAFSPDPVIKGEGFDAAAVCNYSSGERNYSVTALSPLAKVTLTLNGETLDVTNNTVEGVTVSGLNTTAMRITLTAPFFNALPSGSHTIELYVEDSAGGAATVDMPYNLQGVTAYTNYGKEVLTWTGGSTFVSATVFGSPSDVEFICREGEGEWKRFAATANGSNTYTAQVDIKPSTTYEYRLVIGGTEVGASRHLTTRAGAQIPNGDMEGWSKSGDAIVPDPSSTAPYWCSGNYGTASFGGNITYESTDVRPGSKGKKSAYMGSKYIVVKFAAGNMYVGSWGGMNGMNATVYFGQPFTFDAKPKAIRFWAKYNCGIIDRVDKGVGKKGDPDLLKIFCCLTTATHKVDSSDGNGTTFSPSDANIKSGDARYNIVLYSAYMESTESQNDWKMYEIPFTFYGDDPNQVPTHLILTYTCSGYGDFFDGSTSSWMYVDDIELVY
ncbi:MAG: DUF4493 domain-containing protein [Alistipes sp.]|nr:DUF4493 domain-containing protein [Alistipes sp.]